MSSTPEEGHFVSTLLVMALSTLAPDERRLLTRYYNDKVRKNHEERIQFLCKELGIPKNALRIRVNRLRRKVQQHIAQLIDDAPTIPAEEPNPVSPAQISTQTTNSQPPPLEHLRRRLQNLAPVLYAQVLEPTLADLREEHSTALAEGRPLKARCVLLQGCGALAAAAICQFGYSLLGRIAALWRAKSPK